MGAAGWLCTWGGQRTSQHLPSHQCPARRYRCHPGAHARSGQPATPLDQLLSASLAFIEAAESFLKKKGRDFPKSQGKTCADLPQPQKERPSADRGTNRPKQCMWPRHSLMQGLVQPRDEICPLEYHCCHRRRTQNVTLATCTQEGFAHSPCSHSGPKGFPLQTGNPPEIKGFT